MNATASLLADTICRTVELGVTITDDVADGSMHLFCAPIAPDPVCGVAGRLRDRVERKVTDLPIVVHRTGPPGCMSEFPGSPAAMTPAR
ncbi:hypothetical protein ACIGIG_15710 [Dietzia maris]|uniref:hypothetical protein n=1 Tax=Dietzia maris TaxID=37915 RepID=UPI0037C984FA